MDQTLTIAMAQINLLVGDIEGNAERVVSAAIKARGELGADLIVFPELALTSYPPEDLLLRPGLYRRVNRSLDDILEKVHGIDIILGFPTIENGQRYNSAALLRDGKVITLTHKQRLPNYSVFDEARYFTPGTEPCLVVIKGIPTAISICEDLWHHGPMIQAKHVGAKLMISINASPFDLHKRSTREKIMAERAREGDMPIIYVNLVGGQDELVFDGGSMAISAQGEIIHHAPFYEEVLEVVKITTDKTIEIISKRKNPDLPVEERVYQALVLGVRDYIEKNHFPGAVIGLSGGIDSALTLAIAVDAIGANRVTGVLMPSRFTREMSIEDAKTEANALNVAYSFISIDSVFQSFLDLLADEFSGLSPDTTEENLQARCRGMILMAISNKKGSIVLSTGNKSEMSVGYATLYGDMVGGFCVLKDVPKTLVYRLANYRNTISEVIPQRVIDRPPSAELADNQYDQDSLPPYDLLDKILELYIERDESVNTIIEMGYDVETVHNVVNMIQRNEYKRHQAPVGVRISQKGFGRDRRYPITSGYERIFRKS